MPGAPARARRRRTGGYSRILRIRAPPAVRALGPVANAGQRKRPVGVRTHRQQARAAMGERQRHFGTREDQVAGTAVEQPRCRPFEQPRTVVERVALDRVTAWGEQLALLVVAGGGDAIARRLQAMLIQPALERAAGGDQAQRRTRGNALLQEFQRGVDDVQQRHRTTAHNASNHRCAVLQGMAIRVASASTSLRAPTRSHTSRARRSTIAYCCSRAARTLTPSTLIPVASACRPAAARPLPARHFTGQRRCQAGPIGATVAGASAAGSAHRRHRRALQRRPAPSPA